MKPPTWSPAQQAVWRHLQAEVVAAPGLTRDERVDLIGAVANIAFTDTLTALANA